MLFLFKVLGCFNYSICEYRFFFTTPLMIVDALWVSYVTCAFLNSLFIVFFHVSFKPIPILRYFSFVIL